MATIRRIVAACAWCADVSPDDVLGPKKLHHLIPPRFAAICIARSHGMSMLAIGRGFNRDHTSVVHALKFRDGREPNTFPGRLEEIIRIEALALKILAGEVEMTRRPKLEPKKQEFCDKIEIIRKTRNGYVRSDGAIVCNPW